MQKYAWRQGLGFGIVLTILGQGCGSTPKPSLPPRPWMATRAGTLKEQSMEAFGVKFTVRATSTQAVNAGMTELARTSALLDQMKTGSDVARVNEKAFESPVTVSSETANLLRAAQTLYQLSDHKFDVTFVPYSQTGDNEFNAITEWDKKEKLSPKTLKFFGDQNLLLDPDTRQVRIYNKRLKLNFRGMARGYAVEMAIHAMMKADPTGGEILSENFVGAYGSELKNRNIFCIENPDHLGACVFHINPTDLSRPLFIGISASTERRGIIYDPKDTWTYRAGGVTVAGQKGLWVQFGATITSLMDDGQLNTFLTKTINPKLSAIYFDQSPAHKLKGSLLPFAKISP